MERWRLEVRVKSYVGDLVHRGVGAEREVRAGHVVADGGRNQADRDAQLGVLLASVHQLNRGHVRLHSRASFECTVASPRIRM